MKDTNFKFLGFSILLLMTFSMTLQAQKEEKVIIKKTKDKNGTERVETITTKNGETKVTVMIDGKAIEEEVIKLEQETILIKNGNQTLFIEELDDLTEELELTFENLELKLNNMEIPNYRMGILEDEQAKDDEGYLGVELKEKQLSNNGERVKIVVITEVKEESAAAEAGLEVGDIIRAVDGKAVRNLSQLMHLIKANAPGETVTIDYLRGDERLQTQATLKQKEDKNFISFGEDAKIQWNEKGKIEWYGDEDFSIQLPRRSQKGKLGITLGKTMDEGIAIAKVAENSAAETAGIEKGDIITKIDGQNISSKSDLLDILEDKKPNETIEITYLRDNSETTTKATLKKSNTLFSFDNEDARIRLEEKEGKWNFEWTEDADDVFLGVILGEEVTEGLEIDGTIDNSAAQKAGLEKGDIITEIDGETIKTKTELINKVKEYKSGELIEVTYIRAKNVEKVSLKLGTKSFSIRKPKDIKIIVNEEEETTEEIFEETKMPEVIPADKQLEMMQLDLYPNPNEGAFNLNFETEAAATILTITNEKGDAVLTTEMANFNGVFSDKIDISNQPAGTYYLTISQGEKKMMKRINVVK